MNESAAVIETWRAVVGFEGFYEVSDLGRVRSLDRIVKIRRKKCVATRYYAGRILKLPKNKDGYAVVTLSTGFVETVHTLVLTAFVGPKPPGFQCLHGDGDQQNNSASNLRWGTVKENSDDKTGHGTRPIGSLCNFAKLTEDQVRNIKESSSPRRALAAKYRVSISTVDHIKQGLSWRHVA